MTNPSDTDMDTNVTAFPNKTAIKEEAGAWIARIDEGKLEDAEVRELQNWVQRSDFHRDYLLKLAANWDAMGALGELAELFPLPQSEPHRSQAPAGRPRLKNSIRLPVAVAAAALMAVLVFTLSPLFGPTGSREFATAVGERASFILKDGTSVTLNTNSRLKVEYTDARRTLTLMRGEANFEVTRDPERPFLVYAGGGMVWAVGTAFNVRYTDDAVDVTVTEGRVKVFSDTRADKTAPQLTQNIPPSNVPGQTPDLTTADSTAAGTATAGKSKEALLDAGQSIRYRQVIKSLKPIREEELTRKLAWQQGALIFKGETLEQALAEIARYTDKKIVIADPALGQLKIGGHYKTDDINALLASLGQGLGIHVEHAADNRILLSARADL